MRFLFFLFLLTVSGFLMAPVNAYAVGLGPYIEHTSGSGDYSGDNTYSGAYGESIDIDTQGLGFVFDSNVTKPQAFNYRLHIGYSDLDIPYDFDGYRITIDNTFGFGIINNENFRWWIGPHLHLNYSNWDRPIGGTYYEKDSVDFFGIGTGVVTGMNFHLPGVVSICPELGLRYQYNASDTYEEYYDSYYYYEQDFSYDEVVFFVKVNLLFRLGE